MTISPNLSLSYVAPQQAQKHVTVNETFRRLDALVQLTAQSAGVTAEPVAPAEGDVYLLPANASGPSWDGMAAFAVAVFQDGAWAAISPKPGWRAWVRDNGAMYVFADDGDGDGWRAMPGGDSGAGVVASPSSFGVNTNADDVSRFAVKSDVALLSHDDVTPGSGDVRHVINKATAANTASVVFQSNYSGRAEFGLTGNDDFTLKVSADGGVFTDAATFDKSTGNMQISGKTTSMTCAAGDPIPLEIRSDGGGAVFRATRYIGNSAGAVFFGRKARGSAAAPAAVASGDTILGFRAYAHNGAAFQAGGGSCAAFLLEASEGHTVSAGGGQIRFFTVPNGTLSAAERLRVAHDGALQMGGANTVISPSRHHRLRAYGRTSLPSAATPGEMIFVSDATGGAVPAFSDGANWRRMTDRTVVS